MKKLNIFENIIGIMALLLNIISALLNYSCGNYKLSLVSAICVVVTIIIFVKIKKQ